MEQRTCSVDGCDRPSKARGWCYPHWSRWRKTGDLGVGRPFKPPARPNSDPCSVEGCNNPHLARGWCGKHYQCWREYGDPLATAGAPPSRTGPKRNQFVTIGQRFGRWIVTGLEVRTAPTKSNPNGQRAAPVKCTCPRGTERIVHFSSLFSGKSRCCGCIGNEHTSRMMREANPAITHGLTQHPLFDTWRKILRRCENPADKSWPSYGGRGISVYPGWHDPAAFIADIEAEIGPRPEGRYPSGRPRYSLDRVDPDGNYEPGGVRWATALQQRHNRRPPRRCACGTEYHTVAKVCRTCGATLRA